MKNKNKVKLLTIATLLTTFLINTGIQSSNQIENNTAQAATNKKKTKPSGQKPKGKLSKKMGTPPSGKKPSGKPGQKPNGKSGKGGPNTQSYDYKGTLKASLNVKSGTTKVGKKTITNNKTDQNVALVQKNGKLSLDGTKLKKTVNSKNDDSANFYDLDSILLANGKNAVATVKNAKVTTKGTGSPLAYSTGTINFNNVTGTASGSQIAGMEGYNKISLVNSDLMSTNNKISGSDPIKNGVIIYQSTSGDAETSSSKSADFQAKDSTLKTAITSGAMFYVTNTTGKITLENTKLNFNNSKVDLLNVAGNNSNGWGTKGKNGGHVTLTAKNQTLKGNIVVGSISSANVKLTDDSTYTGKTSIVANKYATSSSKSKTPLTISVGSNSKWIVTGNSTVTNLNLADGGEIVDSQGNKVTIIANGKTVQKGTSSYAVTVKGSFTTN
ncbi:MAG TPA: hypothetical protein K8V23_01490 [Lactobacillus crispatus]|uniref:Adhesin n=1 Tax=Lactobacillus crispatus TaxID=47770 RepID=A0A921FHH3_9LACO|nr:hypothetical protein [Lactobacillus crispatus]